MDVARRTIVALDFDDAEKAIVTVERLGDAGRSFKIGLELSTAAGPAIVRSLVDAGKDVFLDLKLFEIPASVAAAVRVAGRLGATMVSVHAMGGPTILDAAVRAAADLPHLRVVALTVVTSHAHRHSGSDRRPGPDNAGTHRPRPAAVLTHLHNQLTNHRAEVQTTDPRTGTHRQRQV